MTDSELSYQKSIKQSTKEWVKDFLEEHKATKLEDVPTMIIIEEMKGTLVNLESETFMVDCRKDYLQVLVKALGAQ